MTLTRFDVNRIFFESMSPSLEEIEKEVGREVMMTWFDTYHHRVKTSQLPSHKIPENLASYFKYRYDEYKFPGEYLS